MISTDTLIETDSPDLSFADSGVPNGNRRVLHIVNGAHYAGAARVQDLLALSLPAFGYQVEFACILPDKFDSERQSHCPLHNFPMKHRLDFSPARQIAELVKSERYDVIHSHTTRSAMIGTLVARMTSVPYVHHVHCQMNTEIGRRLQSFINTSIERLACRSANQVVAVSRSIRRFLQFQRFTDNVSVVPNGVPQPQTPRSLRHAADPWVIGMVALLRERKGLETLLAALPQLAARHDVRLRIVGPFETPEYEQSIRRLANRLGVNHLVDWTGFVRDVPREIAKMDALVLPSVLPEGMPMVLLEAMSTGVPVVGSRVDGITDVIQHEANGLLAEPGDADALATQLARIISGEVDWHQLRRCCIQRYHECYSQTAMARAMATVYDRVLAPKAAATRTALRMELVQ